LSFCIDFAIENGTIQKLGYSFLFAFHSSHGSDFYHLRDIGTNCFTYFCILAVWLWRLVNVMRVNYLL